MTQYRACTHFRPSNSEVILLVTGLRQFGEHGFMSLLLHPFHTVSYVNTWLTIALIVLWKATGGNPSHLGNNTTVPVCGFGNSYHSGNHSAEISILVTYSLQNNSICKQDVIFEANELQTNVFFSSGIHPNGKLIQWSVYDEYHKQIKNRQGMAETMEVASQSLTASFHTVCVRLSSPASAKSVSAARVSGSRKT